MNYFKHIITAFVIVLIFSTTANAQTIAAGGWHSLAICNDSTVKTFGENATGQLGDASNEDREIPVSAIGLSGIISVSGGGDQLEAHSMALKNDGTVWSWGSNLYGGLGNGNNINTNVPGQVLLLNNVTQISAGGWHSSALKNDGTVWTWGWNTDGQLGDGTLVNKIVPNQVSGLSDIIQISAGTFHMLALKSDGTVWAWGDNISGQIGDGTTTDKNTPVQVSGLTDVAHISAGRFFSLAIKNDGSVWTWGENKYGQLGIGNKVDSSVPVQVPGITASLPAVVATGAFHCLILKTDGTVSSWGRNTYGNLGDESVEHRLLPVEVLGITNATALAAGTNFSLFVKEDGTFWGCGRNASGQLGDGTLLQRNTIVQSTYLCTVMIPVGISSNDYSKSLNVNIYPNPTKDIVYVEIEENTKVEITNLQGQIVKMETLNNTTNSIDLNGLNSGVYLVKVITDEKFVVKKMIIR